MTTEEICIIVKAQPTPSRNNWETVCCGGITRRGEWRRLHPLPFRLLDGKDQFHKYQWISIGVDAHTSDKRPESRRPDLGSLELLGSFLPAGNWRERMEIVQSGGIWSLEDLTSEQEAGRLSMGTVQVSDLTGVLCEPVPEAELRKWRNKTSQQQLALDDGPVARRFEPTPFRFRYHFKCSGRDCPGHKITTVDWEAHALYRRALHGTRDQAAAAEEVRQQFLTRAGSSGRDLYFYVGTHRVYGSWLIGGFAAPLKSATRTPGLPFDL